MESLLVKGPREEDRAGIWLASGRLLTWTHLQVGRHDILREKAEEQVRGRTTSTNQMVWSGSGDSSGRQECLASTWRSPTIDWRSHGVSEECRRMSRSRTSELLERRNSRKRNNEALLDDVKQPHHFDQAQQQAFLDFRGRQDDQVEGESFAEIAGINALAGGAPPTEAPQGDVSPKRMRKMIGEEEKKEQERDEGGPPIPEVESEGGYMDILPQMQHQMRSNLYQYHLGINIDLRP